MEAEALHATLALLRRELEADARLDRRTTRVSSEETLDGKLFCTFVGLILTCWLREAMQESGLADDYTLDSMLDEVEAVEMFEHEGRRPALGEITAKQRNVFEKLKVDLPALSQ